MANTYDFPNGAVRHFRLGDHGKQKEYEDLFLSISSSSSQVIDRAQEQADKMLSAAKAQTDEIIQNAETQAEEIVRNAELQAEEIVHNAEIHAQQLLHNAETDSARIIQSAETEAAEIVQNAEAQATGIVRTASSSSPLSAETQEFAIHSVESCIEQLRRQLLDSVEIVDQQWNDFLRGLVNPKGVHDSVAVSDTDEEIDAPPDIEEKVSAIARELLDIAEG